MGVNDLECLETGGKDCGLEFRRDQKTHKWYERWMDDYHGADAAYRHGVRPEDYGKCEHALAIPGDAEAYEIGVLRAEDGKGYRLVWDNYGGGFGLEEKVGKDACKLKQRYAVAMARKVAARKGHKVTEVALPDGSVKLTMRVPVRG